MAKTGRSIYNHRSYLNQPTLRLFGMKPLLTRRSTISWLITGLAALTLAACRSNNPVNPTDAGPLPTLATEVVPVVPIQGVTPSGDVSPPEGAFTPICYPLEFEIAVEAGVCPRFPFFYIALSQRFERGWIVAARQESADAVVYFILYDDGRVALSTDLYGSPWTFQYLQSQAQTVTLDPMPEGMFELDSLLVPVWVGIVGPLGDLRQTLGWPTLPAEHYEMTYQPVPPVTYMHGPEGRLLLLEPDASGVMMWRDIQPPAGS